MKQLKERILSDGKCLDGGILKVDNFINHQMDPVLMREMAKELVRRFSGHTINKVMTVEASGIAPAIMVGDYLNVPVLFAKKKTPSTMDNMLVTEVFSFTKNKTYTVCVFHRAFAIDGYFRDTQSSTQPLCRKHTWQQA